MVCLELLFHDEKLLFFHAAASLKAQSHDIGHKVDKAQEALQPEAVVVVVEDSAECSAVGAEDNALTLMAVEDIVYRGDIPVHNGLKALAVALGKAQVCPASAEHIHVVAVPAVHSLAEPFVGVDSEPVLLRSLLYGVIAALVGA